MCKISDILDHPEIKESLIIRLSKNLKENDTTGCIEWQGKATYNGGYGKIGTTRQFNSIRAHRLAWVLENGPIPEGLIILHSCDNPKCCNVEHLSLGTKKDNSQDMLSKGRHYTPFRELDFNRGNPETAARGEDNGNSTLTEELVKEIRAFEGNHQQAADYFNISHTNAWRVRTFRSWEHVE